MRYLRYAAGLFYTTDLRGTTVPEMAKHPVYGAASLRTLQWGEEVELPNGLVVVDYKTDRATSESEIGNAVDRYRLQAAAYAEVGDFDHAVQTAQKAVQLASASKKSKERDNGFEMRISI